MKTNLAMDISTPGLVVLIIILCIAVIPLFIFIRKLVLAYWEIDTIVKNQEENNRLLERIYALLEKERNDRNKIT